MLKMEQSDMDNAGGKEQTSALNELVACHFSYLLL